MNAKQQSWLAGGLGALAAVVWIPQLLAGEAEEPEPRAEAPAAGAPAEPTEGEVPAAAQAAVEPPAGLAEVEAALEALAREDGGLDVAELLAGAGGAATLVAPEEALDGSAELRAFAAQNPLAGLIHGAGRSTALLGHRIVRAGDKLQGGRVTVFAIGDGWVELACDEERLLLELPAFEARAGAPTSSGRPASASGVEPALPPAAAAGGRGA